MLDYLHRPQNALLHEKSNKMILANVTPLLTQLIEEGIEQHIFENDFPAETAEMILLIISGFMDGSQAGNPQRRLDSLLFNLERLLGAERGTLLSFNNLITQ